MRDSIADNRNEVQAIFPNCVIYRESGNAQLGCMIRTAELIATLRERKIRNKDIASALGLQPSRATEIMAGDRALKLDEAATLVDRFGLEKPPSPGPVATLPPGVARLMVLHVAKTLGAVAFEGDPRLNELIADFEAFGRYVTDPKIRSSLEAAETFFQAMRLRHADPSEASQSGTGHAPTH